MSSTALLHTVRCMRNAQKALWEAGVFSPDYPAKLAEAERLEAIVDEMLAREGAPQGSLFPASAERGPYGGGS